MSERNCVMLLLFCFFWASTTIEAQFIMRTSEKNMDAKELRRVIKDAKKYFEERRLFFLEVNKRPHFWVEGEIRQTDENGILIWGYARPEDGDMESERYGSAIYQPQNIYVKNPIKGGIQAYYYGPCLHSFVGKETGTNAFGGGVPILVYDHGYAKEERDTVIQMLDRKEKKMMREFEEELKRKKK